MTSQPFLEYLFILYNIYSNKVKLSTGKKHKARFLGELHVHLILRTKREFNIHSILNHVKFDGVFFYPPMTITAGYGGRIKQPPVDAIKCLN